MQAAQRAYGQPPLSLWGLAETKNAGSDTSFDIDAFLDSVLLRDPVGLGTELVPLALAQGLNLATDASVGQQGSNGRKQGSGSRPHRAPAPPGTTASPGQLVHRHPGAKPTEADQPTNGIVPSRSGLGRLDTTWPEQSAAGPGRGSGNGGGPVEEGNNIVGKEGTTRMGPSAGTEAEMALAQTQAAAAGAAAAQAAYAQQQQHAANAMAAAAQAYSEQQQAAYAQQAQHAAARAGPSSQARSVQAVAAAAHAQQAAYAHAYQQQAAAQQAQQVAAYAAATGQYPPGWPPNPYGYAAYYHPQQYQMQYQMQYPPSMPPQMAGAAPPPSSGVPSPGPYQQESGGSEEADEARAVKRPRLIWTQALHRRFLQSVDKCGGVDRALPKAIMKRMDVNGLTRENVASHLQKYRLRVRKDGNADDMVPDDPQVGGDDHQCDSQEKRK